MIKVSRTVTLQAGQEAVWPYVADPARFAEWRGAAGVTGAAALGEGPMVVGSRFRMDVSSQGRSGTIECTVTACEPNRRFAFSSMDNSGFAGAADTRLEPERAGTRLTWEFTLVAPGAWKLLQPLISRSVNQAADSDFATLQGLLAR